MKFSTASLLLMTTSMQQQAYSWLSDQSSSITSRAKQFSFNDADKSLVYLPPKVKGHLPTQSNTRLCFMDDANFAPVATEQIIREFNITGKIPEDLTGIYGRNGANPKSGNKHHLFFGEGMVHAIKLAHGQAIEYISRYVNSNLEGFRAGNGLSNVALLEYNNKFYSLGEYGPAFELDPNTLTTVKKFNFDGKATPNICAHPKKDLTGRLYFFGYRLTEKPYLTYYSASASGQLDKIEPIELDAPKMIHDFMISENHVIFMDLPLLFKPAKVAAMLARAVLGLEQTLPVSWEPNRVARLGVMPKTGNNADIQWFHIDPCFIFHTVNAYEQHNTIVFDAIRYEHFKVGESIDLSEPSYLTRFTLNLENNSVQQHALDDHSVEFPQINPNKMGSAYRYVYGTLNSKSKSIKESEMQTGLIKYDLHTMSHAIIPLPSHLVFGEFSFAEKENAKHEDDGYLMGYVYNKLTETSALWIFNARNFEAEPLAIVDVGIRIPNGFHGLFKRLNN